MFNFFRKVVCIINETVKFKKKTEHPYHLVEVSAHPLLLSIGLLLIVIVFVFGALHKASNLQISSYLFILGLNLFDHLPPFVSGDDVRYGLCCPWIYFMQTPLLPCFALYGSFLFFTSLYGWFYTIVIEAKNFGKHNLKVRKGLNLGFNLFIISEIFFFVAFFWAYIYNARNPSVEIGAQWPPLGIQPMHHLGVPMLESCLLFISWFTINQAVYSIQNCELVFAKDWFLITIILGIFFLLAQLNEYINYRYSISDSVFGGTFFMATGLHGMHVLVGIIFIFVGYIRLHFSHFTPYKNLWLVFAVRYWHFVDAVWIGLFFIFYFKW